MRLQKARVTKYRSIRDSGWFEVEEGKTILVGPNEAGKTALLEALQQLSPPQGIQGFDPLRDYPRSEYNDITKKNVLPENVTVVEGRFLLEDEDKNAIPEEFRESTYVVGRKLDNSWWHRLEGLPVPTYAGIKKDLIRLSAYTESRLPVPAEGANPPAKPSAQLAIVTKDWEDTTVIKGEHATKLATWLQSQLPLIEEGNQTEELRYDSLVSVTSLEAKRSKALEVLDNRRPVFVLFSNYFRVRPLIHLEHLAQRLESNAYDDASYDYGNKCLLQLLGFTARELSNLGKAAEPQRGKALSVLLDASYARPKASKKVTFM